MKYQRPHRVIELQNEQIGAFLEAIESARSDYNSINGMIIAYRWHETWTNVHSRFIVSTKLASQGFTPRIAPKIDDLSVISFQEPIERLNDFVDIFDKGELLIQGNAIIYKKPQNDQWIKGDPPWFSRLQRTETKEQIGLDCFSYLLGARQGGQVQFVEREKFRRLESQLSSLEPPFIDLKDLVSEFIGPLTNGQPWWDSVVELYAPVQIRLSHECELRGKDLFYQIEGDLKHNFGDARIGFAVYENDRPKGRSSRTPGSPPTYADDLQTYSDSIEIGGSEWDTLKLILSYRGEGIDQMEFHTGAVSGENGRMVTQAVTDPELAKFRESLLGKAKGKGRGLERGVLLLFHFLGHAVVSADPESTDSIDLLAFTENPKCLFLIECTTDAIDLRSKLTRISSRKRAYEAKKKGIRIATMIATSLERSDVNAQDLERATGDGVIVLSSEDLRSLLQMATKGAVPGMVKKYLLNKAYQQGIRNVEGLL